jgi:hypothetical protein
MHGYKAGASENGTEICVTWMGKNARIPEYA